MANENNLIPTKSHVMLFAIVLGGLILRLFLLTFIQNPGLNDQNHYYNLGHRIAQRQGLTIDYVWHYSSLPEDIVHPIDHWMPLAGVAVAFGMALGGESPQSALTLFIVAGTALPLLVFGISKQLKTSDQIALMASLFTAILPDIVWNSLRTDTTIINMVLIVGAVYLLNDGLRTKRWWTYITSGFLVGLAYLTRNDSIVFLPMVVVLLVLYVLMGRTLSTLRSMGLAFILIPLTFFMTIAPWLARNQQELGMLGTAETSRMFFMVDQRDHYAYGMDITFATMLERQTIEELITKRLFEVGASIYQMGLSLDVVLVIAVPAGILWFLWKRDWDRLLLIAPAIIWIAGIMVAYPILLPLKSQSGSFEKAFLTVLPLLIPIGAVALDRFIVNRRLLIAIVVLTSGFMIVGSYRVVQEETAKADTYYASILKLVETLETLPDVTGDEQIHIMSQDPYVMSFFGYPSIMTPLSTREDAIELAQRYQIDYVLMPAGRPALKDLYLQAETDERFVLAAHIADAGEKPFELYRIDIRQ